MLGFRVWSMLHTAFIDCSASKIRMNDTGSLVNSLGQYIDPFSLIPMQSTGLKDCNGVEVFESDVVQIYHTMHIYVVKLPEFLITLGEWNSGLDDETVYKHITVLGNRYENPELLEKINAC